MTVKQKYNSLDITKLMMAIVVIGIHTNPLKDCRNLLLQKGWIMLQGCAVPFFFLAAGYLLAVKFREPADASENIAVLKAYLRKMIKLYLLWSVIYLPLAIVDYINKNVSLLYATLHYIRGLIFVGEHHNSWMLWYLLSTIYALLFVLSCLKHGFSFEKILLGGILIFALSIGFDRLVEMEGTVPGVLFWLKTAVYFTIGNGRILSGIFYIPCGMLLAKKRIPLWVNCIVLPLALAGGGYDGIEIPAGVDDRGLRHYPVWYRRADPV